MDRLVNLSISDLSFLITVKVRKIFIDKYSKTIGEGKFLLTC